ncbi:efflux RND transporter periplasmic adaptor subunit [Parapedobacter pyrenivorans]|uniref:efflux RND transporter periplasmic adaptor subunit n=1 Tax=Parapedobacter pyrenivorans TaxID=1305674 RepID=UPI00333FBFCD
MNTSIRFNTKTLIYIILAAPILLFISSCSTGSSKTNNDENNAIALPVQQIDTTTAVTIKDYLGTIEGKVNVEIRPQVEGILEEIYVDEGAFVKEGQKLFKINPLPYQEELNNALANENVEKAKLENAKLEVERLRPLVENDVISEVRLRTAKSDFDVAKASLDQASAAVASARINLEFTTIKAPVSGFIGLIPKRIGNLVSGSDPLTELSDISEVYVYFAMSESDFLYFRKKYGKKDSTEQVTDTTQLIPNVSLVMADGTVYPETGVVDAINGQVNRTTGAISLRATFPNKDFVLRSGNTGTVKMEERQPGVITVPQVATTELQDKVFVYTLSADNKVKQQAIEVIGKSGDQYVVQSGVNVGDRIALSGMDKLSDGMEIKPLNVPDTSAK